jgi:hypothetical protein
LGRHRNAPVNGFGLFLRLPDAVSVDAESLARYSVADADAVQAAVLVQLNTVDPERIQVYPVANMGSSDCGMHRDEVCGIWRWQTAIWKHLW